MKVTRLTPTSVKKPAIPAWQEPCSSPYFFLYSGGRERKADHGHVSMCQACANLATSLTLFGLCPGIRSRLRHRKKVLGLQDSKMEALKLSGSQAAECFQRVTSIHEEEGE